LELLVSVPVSVEVPPVEIVMVPLLVKGGRSQWS
jgi:hypothetical protein